ncbi:hypothetical protein BDZ90DRAFT_229889 [Jaminaea rosea]|uniref:Uncharacterized protein n=1 Tax=Jaminaea rosea TaxID=1569628 RepID=A0A316V025_9BASI|nr:hypothetical protein BDZ90DRAFT_229889 [Jaminaea rosea]PWN30899.1 hypothetical protein BDZ90DRAFT_229889 [Jaminaea rosea]
MRLRIRGRSRVASCGAVAVAPRAAASRRLEALALEESNSFFSASHHGTASYAVTRDIPLGLDAGSSGRATPGALFLSPISTRTPWEQVSHKSNRHEFEW